MSSSRNFSPYELTQLARHGVSSETAQKMGEMPVEYITGKVDFANQTFHVTQDTLIPRVESEKIVELACEHIASNSITAPNILDMGTGSGALGISTLLALPSSVQTTAHVALADISAEALNVTKQNMQKLVNNNLHQHISLLQSDLWQNIPPQTFDVIIANLPYIPEKTMPTLDASVVDFEPHQALDGGKHGLTNIAAFLKNVDNYLTPNGLVILEVDETHTPKYLAEKIPDLYAQFAWQALEDCFGKHRFLLVTQPTDAG